MAGDKPKLNRDKTNLLCLMTYELGPSFQVSPTDMKQGSRRIETFIEPFWRKYDFKFSSKI